MSKLPVRGLSRADIERLWGKDITEYKICAKKHNVLVDAIEAR